MPSGSFQVTVKLVGQEDNKEIPGAGHAVFAKCGSGGVAMSNHLIIAEISSYLDDRELESWYESFGKFIKVHLLSQFWEKTTPFLKFRA